MFRRTAQCYIFVLLYGISSYWFVHCNDIEHALEDDELTTTIEVFNYKHDQIPIGENVTVICKTKWIKSYMWWTFNERNVSEEEGFSLEVESENINEGKKYEVSILHIFQMDFRHIGNYVCHSVRGNDEMEIDFSKIILNITVPSSIVDISAPVYSKIHQSVNLSCSVKGYPIEEIYWLKNNDRLSSDIWQVHTVNESIKNTTISMREITKKDNGTYTCVGVTSTDSSNKSSHILVLDKPTISIDFMKAIGANKIYLNWTVNDGNDPKHLKYRMQYKSDKDSNWFYYQKEIEGNKRSYVLKDMFKNNTQYAIRIMASNSEGESPYVEKSVTTLNEDPVFVPEVKVTGVTVSSITIKWTDLHTNLTELIHYYQLILAVDGTKMETVYPAHKDNLYMFSALNPATVYSFQVAACSDYTKTCGPWSETVNGTTMDGLSGPPANASIECRYDNISHTSFVFVSWKPPVKPHGTIMSYNINVEGSASFKNEQGVTENLTWGPKVTSLSESMLNTRFYNVSANTNYTVRISGVTRTKRNGAAVELTCAMPATLPDKQQLSRIQWRKIEEQKKWLFKLQLPRISERNGPICCYRVYVVRMEPQQKLAELPTPDDLIVVSYQEAHRTPKGGVYVAETFDSASYHPEIFLGDEQFYNATGSMCDDCIGLTPYGSAANPNPTPKTNITNETPTNVRRKRTKDLPLPPFDGCLDINSNYSAFVEILVRGSNQETLAAYSNYLVMMNPGPEVIVAPPTGGFTLILKFLWVVLLVVIVSIGMVYVLHHYSKQAHAQAVEMITFRTSLRHLYRSLRGRQRLVSLNPPDMCPISQEDLISAYTERHRDSDYGFQQEFELLPDRFSDRTTRASDSRDNVYKNRYPDIKAYDQTRVKLSQIDSIAGSDYINANYVLSYKERKKFICAQGPMDNTVNDFWRMIWEQHLELILMLTNLEEYSKTKCSKYWPDKDGEKVFGEITVAHVEEIRYSDYIVRNLKIFRKIGTRVPEERKITQYHYLVWKDFMAPEHTNGIIQFIKRINEIYSIEKGCILVHCSAGVGRTGTLVALDCLLQQLREEGHVSIFNTICDLRHQRNFLVQSLKQYIFIYRALKDVAQFGDTEISLNELKSTAEAARKVNSNNKCNLEEEFEKILYTSSEEKKSAAVACADENKDKNRSDSVVPFDRNRVILTPLSGREHSTYINASFIEGYDNFESFIITQDPMENTINDFWRMVAEQGISVIVMLSELGEDKCPRYWPEDESTYDHITVRYAQAESCPYYTRREMYVKSRDGEDYKVTHLQYHGWPTVDGEVPEVTRGLIELVDHSQSSITQNTCSPSIVVHCNFGADRSSMFVGLSILVQQLRIEKRVDIFTLTQKLRSQRLGLLSTYSQYEFLHRAIVNYAELHGLCSN